MVKNKIKEIRMREYMLNQTEFSKILGYDLKTVSNWERGISTPTLERAIDVSNKLNRKVNDIWCLE
ncbi:MAG: putative transcriptional regulator [Clostridium sp.]|jgi:putative transcriptional regulator